MDPMLALLTHKGCMPGAADNAGHKGRLHRVHCDRLDKSQNRAQHDVHHVLRVLLHALRG